MTIQKDFFKQLKFWNTITEQKEQTYAIYAGKDNFLGTQGQTYAWTNLTSMLNKIYAHK